MNSYAKMLARREKVAGRIESLQGRIVQLVGIGGEGRFALAATFEDSVAKLERVLVEIDEQIKQIKP